MNPNLTVIFLRLHMASLALFMRAVADYVEAVDDLDLKPKQEKRLDGPMERLTLHMESMHAVMGEFFTP